jgi:excisionase family DNA binding protein
MDRDPGVKAFGIALREARHLRGLTQAVVAAELGVTQQLVGNWEQGSRRAQPAHATQLEDLLDLDDGTLTRHLGYLPMGSAGVVVEHTVVDALAQDPRLTDRQRNVLLDTYREFVGADANAGPTVNIAAAAERRPDGAQLLTVPQAAEALGHNRRTVERWIASGQLRAVRVGPRHPWRVPVGALQGFIDRLEDNTPRPSLRRRR